MSVAAKGRVIGALALVAFALYAGGTTLVDADQRVPGAIAVLLNSAVVVGIGVLAHSSAIGWRPVQARTYLLARILEAGLLGVGLALLLTDHPLAADRLYWAAMLALGLGSLPLLLTLPGLGAAPNWLARWGVGGYALISIGALLELAGVGGGLILSAPGGLFEVVTAVLLVGGGIPARSVLHDLEDRSGPPDLDRPRKTVLHHEGRLH